MRIAIFLLSAAALAVAAVSAADLRSDLREFVALVPRRRLGYIAARHFVLDQRFRVALGYLRSSAFAATWQQIRSTPEFADLVAVATANGTLADVTRLVDSVPQQLRRFVIPNKVPVAMVMQRNVAAFLRDAVAALPRARFSKLMAAKVRNGGEFAKVYAALRSAEFRELLDTARSSTNLAAPLEQLAKHSIDVDQVMEVGFTLLSWGP